MINKVLFKHRPVFNYFVKLSTLLGLSVFLSSVFSPLVLASVLGQPTEQLLDLTAQIRTTAQEGNNTKVMPLVRKSSLVLTPVKTSHQQTPFSTLEIHGYVKADFIYDMAGKGGDVINYQKIPLDSEHENNGDVRFHARQSRINLKKTFGTAMGPLVTVIEGDFLGGDNNETLTNSAVFRIRHAYGSMGNWLLGQTWSTFVDVKSYPETIDLGNAAGQSLLRQPQIRYSKSLENYRLMVSLENPESDLHYTGDLSGGSESVVIQDRQPDIIVRVMLDKNWGHLSLQYVHRRLGAFYKNDGVNNSVDTSGYALGFSGRIMLSDKDDLRFSLVSGLGSGRYIQESTNAAADLYLTGDQLDLSANSSRGGYLAYRHWWSESWRSNIALGFADVDYQSREENDRQSYRTGLINLFHQLNKEVQLGVEYAYGERKSHDTAGVQSGEIKRLQFSVKYAF